MKTKRITGLDLAVGMLLPVIVYYGLHLGIGQSRSTFPREQFHLIFDGAVAVFMFINGLTTGFSAGINGNSGAVQRYLLKRGGVFLALGLLVSIVWPTNLFLVFGSASIAMALILPFHSTILRFLGFALALFAIYIYTLTDVNIALSIFSQAIPVGSVLHLWQNGYYAFVPWFVFMLFGFLFSRSQLHFESSARLRYVVGTLLLLAAVGAELLFEGNVLTTRQIGRADALNTSPLHLTITSFFFAAHGLALFFVQFALKINERWPDAKPMAALKHYAKMKYSMLLAQAAAGALAALLLDAGESFGALTVVIFSLIVTAISALFAYVWSLRFAAGPVELVLRALTTRK